MSKFLPITIDSILNGQTPTEFFAAKDQYGQSVGIDPNLPIDDSAVKPSGVIRSSAFANFASSLDSPVIAIVTTPKTTKIYVVTANGKFYSYDSDFTNQTLIDDFGNAGGAFYQNDYIYIQYGTNLARYGALSGTPSVTESVWTGSTLGSQDALTDNTYPDMLGGGYYPKHWCFEHNEGSNKAYVLDFKDGQGMVHFVKTDKDGVDDGSTYDALDLPFNYMPTSGCGFGKDIAITAIQTTSTVIKQGKSMLFLWDTVSDSFYAAIPIHGIATACFNVNGVLYVLAGDISGLGKHTLYFYAGENTLLPVVSIPEGFPPPAGAVDNLEGLLVWGSFLSTPTNSAVIHAYGSKDGTLPKAYHTIAVSNLTHSADDGMITVVKNVIQNSKNGLVFGGRNIDEGQYYLEKPTTTYGTTTFRTANIVIGQKFQIQSTNIRLGKAVAANMTITPKIYVDTGTSTTLKVINNTNYPNSEKKIIDYTKVSGDNNFTLELTFSGTVLLPVLLPIRLIVELLDE